MEPNIMRINGSVNSSTCAPPMRARESRTGGDTGITGEGDTDADEPFEPRDSDVPDVLDDFVDVDDTDVDMVVLFDAICFEFVFLHYIIRAEF